MGTFLLGQSCFPWRQAIQIDPNQSEALNNVAWALATSSDDRVRNGAEAVTLAERAAQLTEYKQPGILDTLAVAYAEAGRFQDARDTLQKAADLATAAGNEKLRRDILAHRQVIEAGQPIRD